MPENISFFGIYFAISLTTIFGGFILSFICCKGNNKISIPVNTPGVMEGPITSAIEVDNATPVIINPGRSILIV